jgi:hypothetical protein
MSFPAPATTEESAHGNARPGKDDDKPSFPGHARAPNKSTVSFNVTTFANKLKLPWSLAFMPDGKILVTERPGTMRILDRTACFRIRSRSHGVRDWTRARCLASLCRVRAAYLAGGRPIFYKTRGRLLLIDPLIVRAATGLATS